MKNYDISVVTPFHNVSADIFRKCCESMFAQTIGFGRVEWIVVVHNSEPQYRDNVFELLDGYENVRLCVLNDGKRTPSCPRNKGIELATAPYIAFLDADDEFTPDCLKKVLRYTRKHKTQITWFRREYELESEDTIPVTEIVLWDQTREEIIVDKDNWDDEKMFSGVCGMVTSRIYDKSFIDKNGIRFDESVPFAEDYLFNLECYGHAEKICYLPQMIGYHYYINSKSLVQEKKKSPGELVAFAEGYKKVFDTGLKYGFYMDAIISGLCCVLARFIIATNPPMETRKKLKDILGPYLENISPIRVSKLYSEKAVAERYEFPRAVILQPENYSGNDNSDTLIAVDVRTNQTLSPYQRVLRAIISLNHDTDMGNRYGFKKLLTVSGYRKSVPVSDYDRYEPLFRLQTNIGESGIITSDPIKSYIFTLGTMETPKLIPCTDRQTVPIRSAVSEILAGKRTFLLLESMPKKHRFNDNATVNTAWGSIISGIFADEKLSANAKRNMFTAPYDLLFPGEVADYTYLRLLFALSDRAVRQIVAPNTWEVWETLLFLEKNWKDLCADIASGRPDHFGGVISDEFRAGIENSLAPDPERASELEAIFSGGFNEPVIPKVWKKMESVTAFGDGEFAIYTNGIRRYIGNIPHKNGCYIADMTLIGTETEETGLYRLSSVNSFIEFVPTDDESVSVLAGDVQPGKDYSLLISTFSGLYRYRIGDVVRIESLENGMPLFRYRNGASPVMKIKNVPVTTGLISDALLGICRGERYPVTDYAYMENDGNDGFVVYLEMKDDLGGEYDAESFSAELEKKLEELDEGYRSAVAEGRIKPVRTRLIEQETQLLYRDVLMSRINRPTDPVKPVRYIDTPLKERFFASCVIQEEK